MEQRREMERRAIAQGLTVEVRESEAGKANVIQGYAALYDSRTVIWNLFTESIARNAFLRAVAEGDDCRCLFNHDPNYVLGRTKSGTLRLKDDETGLWMENDVPDTQAGRDVLESIRRGDVTGQSFAAIVTKERWTISKNRDEMDHREIQEVQLFDTSVVTYPAYEDTSVGLRSLAEESHKRARAEWERANKPEEPVVVVVDPYLLKVRALRAYF
jgi:HK97 family phage prohead protease